MGRCQTTKETDVDMAVLLLDMSRKADLLCLRTEFDELINKATEEENPESKKKLIADATQVAQNMKQLYFQLKVLHDSRHYYRKKRTNKFSKKKDLLSKSA